MLFLAVLAMPIGYYTLLRFLVSISAGIIFLQHYKASNNTLMVLFGITVLIFNPFIPIYLMNKNIWIPIDLIVGSLFMYQILRYSIAEQKIKLK
jgi:hypothetical protein